MKKFSGMKADAEEKRKDICIRPLNKEVSPDEWEYYDFVEIP